MIFENMIANWKHTQLAALAAMICAMLLSGPAYAQTAQPSVYSSAVRYDHNNRITGTIAPDPDGAGPLGFASTRTFYDEIGLPVKVETGELQDWQPSNIAPHNWPAFTILRTEYFYYDTMNKLVTSAVHGSDGVAVSVTQTNYDRIGRPGCAAVRMNPSAFGNLPASACTMGTEGIQGPDRITRNVYDAEGQLQTVQKAYGTSIQQDYATYTYTDNGKQASVKDANGNLASMTYDGHDRHIRWNFPSKTNVGVTSPTDYEEYDYDANDNRISLRKRDGSTLLYNYDALNRMTVKIVPERAGLAATHTRDVYYGYDLRGLQTFARFDGPGGEGISFGYDGFGRPLYSRQVIDGTDRWLYSAFDKNGNRTQTTHPDGNYFAYSYDGLNRMSVIGRNAPSGLTGYAYNNRGLRSSLASGSWTYFGYDPVGRLNALTQDIAGTARDATYGYGYNPASQMTVRSTSNDDYVWTGAVDVNRSYAVNGLNQYTNVGITAYGYDDNGNLTTSGPTHYTYDIENRMVAASGGLTAGLRYDPLGRLYEVTGAAGTTRFLYDGDELVAEYDQSGGLLRRYVHGSGVDDPMAWFEGASVDSSVAKLMKTDHQGSVVALVDWNGNHVATNRYDEWGVPSGFANGSPPNTGRFQYTGQIWLPEIGMYYYKARIYSPSLGRFMQTDPIGYEDNFNLYSYVGNDPVNKLDPEGKRPVDVYIFRVTEGRSVGHVMITEHNSENVIFSSFPQEQVSARRTSSDQVPASFAETMKSEGGKRAMQKYVVDVPNDRSFDKAAKVERSKPKWDWLPHDNRTEETNCAVGSASILKAGGLNLRTWDIVKPAGLESAIKRNLERGSDGIWRNPKPWLYCDPRGGFCK